MRSSILYCLILILSSTAAHTQPLSQNVDEKFFLSRVNVLRGLATPIFMTAPDALTLVIEGQKYIDPEGLLANVTIDPNNGDSTFFVGRGDRRVVKFLSGHNPSQPLVVGEITINSSGYEFNSVTGVHILAAHLITLPDGLGLWRDDALFLYQYGKGVASYALPSGFYPTEYQRGNIWKTGLILLRRDFRNDNDNVRSIRAVKSIFGILTNQRKAEDFVLFDFQKNNTLFLPVDDPGQGHDGPIISNGIGGNLTHYFSKIQWMNLGKHRFAFYFKHSVKQVAVTDIDSGKTAIALSRDLGINGFKVEPDAHGSARLVGNWMFKDHDVPDVIKWFDSAPAEPQL